MVLTVLLPLSYAAIVRLAKPIGERQL